MYDAGVGHCARPRGNRAGMRARLAVKAPSMGTHIAELNEVWRASTHGSTYQASWGTSSNELVAGAWRAGCSMATG